MSEMLLRVISKVPMLGLKFLEDFWLNLVNGFMRMVMWVWFTLQSVLATILDVLTQFFFIFSGMTPISSSTVNRDGAYESVDIVNFFLGSKTFVDVYWKLALVGLGLVVVFTIIKIIKQDYFERSGPRSKGPIFRDVALSFIAFICVVPIFYFVMQASSALALLVMKIMGYEGGGLGTMLFELSWSDNGESFRAVGELDSLNDIQLGGSYDGDLFSWYPNNTFYAYFWNPTEGEMTKFEEYPRVAQYYWYVFLLTAVAMIKSLGTMILAMVTRLFKLIALFIVAPSPISQIVLDGGAKFKTWKDKVIQEAIKVVGCMMSFMTFMLIASMVSDMDLMRYAFNTSESASSVKNLIDSNSVTMELSNEINSLYYYGDQISNVDKLFNAIGKALLLLGGLGAITDIDATITPLLAGGSSSMELGATGKALQTTTGTVTQGAMNLAKAGVGFAAGAVGKIAGGVAGGVGKGIQEWRKDKQLHRSAKLDEEEKDLKGKDDDRASTGPTASPTGPNAPVENNENTNEGVDENAQTPTASTGEGAEGQGSNDDAAEAVQTPSETSQDNETSDEAAASTTNGGNDESDKATDSTTNGGNNEKDKAESGDKKELVVQKDKSLSSKLANGFMGHNKRKHNRAVRRENREKNRGKTGDLLRRHGGTLAKTTLLNPLAGVGKAFIGKDGILATARKTGLGITKILAKTAAGVVGLNAVYDTVAEGGKAFGAGFASKFGFEEAGKRGKEIKDLKESNRQRATRIVEANNDMETPTPTDDSHNARGSGETNNSGTGTGKVVGTGAHEETVLNAATDESVVQQNDVAVSSAVQTETGEQTILSSTQQREAIDAIGGRGVGAPTVQTAATVLSQDAQRIQSYAVNAQNTGGISLDKKTAGAVSQITLSEGMDNDTVRNLVRTGGGARGLKAKIAKRKAAKEGAAAKIEQLEAERNQLDEDISSNQVALDNMPTQAQLDSELAVAQQGADTAAAVHNTNMQNLGVAQTSASSTQAGLARIAKGIETATTAGGENERREAARSAIGRMSLARGIMELGRANSGDNYSSERQEKLDLALSHVVGGSNSEEAVAAYNSLYKEVLQTDAYKSTNSAQEQLAGGGSNAQEVLSSIGASGFVQETSAYVSQGLDSRESAVKSSRANLDKATDKLDSARTSASARGSLERELTDKIARGKERSSAIDQEIARQKEVIAQVDSGSDDEPTLEDLETALDVQENMTAADEMAIAMDDYNEAVAGGDARKISAAKRKLKAASENLVANRNTAYAGIQKSEASRREGFEGDVSSAEGIAAYAGEVLASAGHLGDDEVKGLSELRTTDSETRQPLIDEVARTRGIATKASKELETARGELSDIASERGKSQTKLDTARTNLEIAQGEEQDLKTGIEKASQEYTRAKGSAESISAQRDYLSDVTDSCEFDEKLEKGYEALQEEVFGMKDYAGDDKESRISSVGDKVAFTKGVMRKLEENSGSKRRAGESDEAFVSRKKETEAKYKAALAFALTGDEKYRDAYDEVEDDVHETKQYKGTVKKLRGSSGRSFVRNAGGKDALGTGGTIEKTIKGYANASRDKLRTTTGDSNATVSSARTQVAEMQQEIDAENARASEAQTEWNNLTARLPEAEAKTKRAEDAYDTAYYQFGAIDEEYESKKAEVEGLESASADADIELSRAEGQLADNTTLMDAHNDNVAAYRDAYERGASEDELKALKAKMDESGRELNKQARRVAPRINRKNNRRKRQTESTINGAQKRLKSYHAADKHNAEYASEIDRLTKKIAAAQEAGITISDGDLAYVDRLSGNLERASRQRGVKVKPLSRREQRKNVRIASDLDRGIKTAGRINSIASGFNVSTPGRTDTITVEVVDNSPGDDLNSTAMVTDELDTTQTADVNVGATGASKVTVDTPVDFAKPLSQAELTVQVKLGNISKNTMTARESLDSITGASDSAARAAAEKSVNDVEDEVEVMDSNELTDAIHEVRVPDERLEDKDQYQKELADEYRKAAKDYSNQVSTLKEHMMKFAREGSMDSLEKAREAIAGVMSSSARFNKIKLKIKPGKK